jgi:hypothetical protein
MLRSNLEPELLYYKRGQPEWDGMLLALGVSRRTVWRDIYEVHHKIADALLHGKSLDIGGCLSRQKGICPKMSGITVPPLYRTPMNGC